MTYYCARCGSKLIAHGTDVELRETLFACADPDCDASGWVSRDELGRESYRGSAFFDGREQQGRKPEGGF